MNDIRVHLFIPGDREKEPVLTANGLDCRTCAIEDLVKVIEDGTLDLIIEAFVFTTTCYGIRFGNPEIVELILKKFLYVLGDFDKLNNDFKKYLDVFENE